VGVVGMQRMNLSVGSGDQKRRLVSLHRLVEERQAQQQHDCQNDEKIALGQQPILTKTRQS
jgi:hypothetical protein